MSELGFGQFTVTFEPADPHLAGPAWVVHRSGEYVGSAGTREGAEEMAATIARFGYFEPTEPRQREALRDLRVRWERALREWIDG